MAAVSEYLDEGIIREHIKIYTKSTGLSCSMVDENGETVYAEGTEYKYCMKFKELTGEKCPCSRAHLYAGMQSEKIGEGYIFFCPGGLINWASPITIKGSFKGALIGGPVQMNLPDEYMADEIIKASHIEMSNKEIMQEYLNMIPLCDTERVRYLSEMLYILAKDIMSEEGSALSERREFYKEQAAISEEIQSIKTKNEAEHISNYYPAEIEKELVAKVKSGDKKGATTILNELLGHVLFDNGSNFEITKARVLELMIVLSRAAVEGGGNLEMIFGLKLKYLKEVNEIDNTESLCFWIVKVLGRFTDCVYSTENQNNSYVLQKAIEYINENYMNDISLESVSNYVYLSTSYFSRLFKKSMGINFIDYLNKVRVEESKKYLPDLRLSLSNIAQLVGFTDQSYYTKMFKKVEGISPGQFRKIVS